MDFVPLLYLGIGTKLNIFDTIYAQNSIIMYSKHNLDDSVIVFKHNSEDVIRHDKGSL
jgi:hypothetical protein